MKCDAYFLIEVIKNLFKDDPEKGPFSGEEEIQFAMKKYPDITHFDFTNENQSVIIGAATKKGETLIKKWFPNAEKGKGGKGCRSTYFLERITVRDAVLTFFGNHAHNVKWLDVNKKRLKKVVEGGGKNGKRNVGS